MSHLASGGNLLGVWVLLKLPNHIRLFKEMEYGKCFHFVRRAFLIGPYMSRRHSTDVNCKVSHAFHRCLC